MQLIDRSGAYLLGELAEEDVEFLSTHLQQKDPTTPHVHLTHDTVDFLVERGLESKLEHMLRSALVTRAECDIEWTEREVTHVLKVRILEGRELPDRDLMDASDPYCVVVQRPVGSAKELAWHRTEVVLNRLDPKWTDERCSVLVTLEDEIAVLVVDKDWLSWDDAMGKCVIDLPNLPEGESRDAWCALEGADPGALRLVLRLVKLHPLESGAGE